MQVQKKTLALAAITAIVITLTAAYLFYGQNGKTTESRLAWALETLKEPARPAETTRQAAGENGSSAPAMTQPQEENPPEAQTEQSQTPEKKPPVKNASAPAQQAPAPPASQETTQAATTPQRQTIATSPTRKISDTEYIAGLETDGIVKIYAHEAEGRTIFTNDTIPDAWFAKMEYDPSEEECFITIYMDEDAVTTAQNLTYGCRMRGNIETGCTNTLVSNWGLKTGNLYTYQYEESCYQEGTAARTDGTDKDRISSGV